MFQAPGVHLACSDQQRVDTARQQVVNLFPLHLGIFFGRRQDELVATLPQACLQALGEFGEEGVHEVGDDQADGVALTRRQTAGQQIRLVV